MGMIRTQVDGDFDPWYVMLSPAAEGAPRDLRLDEIHAKPKVVEVTLDLPTVAAEGAKNARRYVRERWKDIRSKRTADQIASILISRNYRSGKALSTEDLRLVLTDKIAQAISQRLPVRFVLPSFPFKIPNPAKVQHRVADYAEILCLQRLYEITEVVREIGEIDAEFHIISDGAIYSELCGVHKGEYQQYYADIANFIAGMGVSEAIKLADMMNDIIAPYRDEFWQQYDALLPELRRWWESGSQESRVRYLVRNMAGNIDLTPEFSALAQSTVHNSAFLAGSSDAGSAQLVEALSKRIQSKANDAAFEFTALLTTLRRTDLLNRHFADVIRATVHPKPGQWGIHLMNADSRTLPWQGVALRTLRDEWRIVPQSEALARASRFTVDITSMRPLFFSE